MFKGSMTALVTPFNEDGSLDEAGFRTLVEWQIAEGSHGLVPVGTTGESPTLTHAEHKRVVEICVEVAAGRVTADTLLELALALGSLGLLNEAGLIPEGPLRTVVDLLAGLTPGTGSIIDGMNETVPAQATPVPEDRRRAIQSVPAPAGASAVPGARGRMALTAT